MVRVHEKVGGELIVIPHESVLEIVAPSVKGGLREVGIEGKAVEAMHEDVDTRNLCECPPRVLLAQSKCHEGVGRRLVLRPVDDCGLSVFVVWI